LIDASSPRRPLARYENDDLRHNRSIGTEKTRNELAALEQELQTARQAAEESQAALSALDEQRREREGRLSLALRAQEDLERHLEKKRVELARAEAEAALEAFKRALGDRDVAAEAFASAAQSVMSRLQDFDAAQEGVESAWQAVLLSRDPADARAAAAELPGDVRAQHGVFSEALTMLIEMVSQRADEDFERDLVEAAARSPLGNDISNLPAHLQGMARARYLAIAREGRRSRSQEA
jgi:chromosome segregation ATPase